MKMDGATYKVTVAGVILIAAIAAGALKLIPSNYVALMLVGVASWTTGYSMNGFTALKSLSDDLPDKLGQMIEEKVNACFANLEERVSALESVPTDTTTEAAPAVVAVQ